MPEVEKRPINNGSYTLTRDEIFDLGFLRSNPQKSLYKHKDYVGLYLYEEYVYDVSVRDQIAYELTIIKLEIIDEVLVEKEVYKSRVPTKEEIQDIIDKYGNN